MEVITSYLFGRADDKRALPVAAKFDEEMAGAFAWRWRWRKEEGTAWCVCVCVCVCGVGECACQCLNGREAGTQHA